jgi:hydrogenase large subunit
MPTIKIIDPVSRIEGHLSIQVTLDTVSGTQQVTDARATGTLFRGIENILVSRPPGDAPHITERICGVCPVSHGQASVAAIEAAAGASIPANARIMRNLVLGADFLHSHILHFYQLSLLDYVDGPARGPWSPTWASDKRITGAAAATLVEHYLAALDARRKAHELGALFGGRMPHPPTYVPGGFTTTPRAERISAFTSLIGELVTFIEGTYLPDVDVVANAYSDYYSIGAGPRNLLAYGVFDLDASGSSWLLRRGRAEGGSTSVQAVDLAAITEAVTYSWYQNASPVAPSSGQTVATYPKTNAYSWLKAPRYSSKVFEAGPLARMWVNGDYTRGVSVMDRHRARALEALKIAQGMQQWITGLSPTGAVYTPISIPSSGSGVGLTEAPRGALGHWLSLSGGNISRYQVVTPTCWNLSPRDDSGVPGALEQALIGVPVANADEPIEVLRVVHSYDPCLACAVHVARPGKGVTVMRVSPGCQAA